MAGCLFLSKLTLNQVHVETSIIELVLSSLRVVLPDPHQHVALLHQHLTMEVLLKAFRHTHKVVLDCLLITLDLGFLFIIFIIASVHLLLKVTIESRRLGLGQCLDFLVKQSSNSPYLQCLKSFELSLKLVEVSIGKCIDRRLRQLVEVAVSLATLLSLLLVCEHFFGLAVRLVSVSLIAVRPFIVFSVIV